MERAHVGWGVAQASGFESHGERGSPELPPETQQAFTTGMASHILGVRVERLRTWHVRGVLVPSLAAPVVLPSRPGATGRRPGAIGRRYSWADLVVGWVNRELLASGVRLEHVRPAASLLRTGAEGSGAAGVADAPSHLVLLRSGVAALLHGDEAWALPRRHLRAIVGLPLATATFRARVAEWNRTRRGAVPVPVPSPSLWTLR